MPAHGHGLPTRPVARDLGGGRYALEGMKFQMSGAWYVELRIHAGPGEDTARVDFVVGAGVSKQERREAPPPRRLDARAPVDRGRGARGHGGDRLCGRAISGGDVDRGRARRAALARAAARRVPGTAGSVEPLRRPTRRGGARAGVLQRRAPERERRGLVRELPPGRARLPGRSAPRPRARDDEPADDDVVGAAGQQWLFWDGRKDSLWSQALGPLESAVEHGLTRTEVVRFVARAYRREYEDVFGPLPGLEGLPRAPRRSATRRLVPRGAASDRTTGARSTMRSRTSARRSPPSSEGSARCRDASTATWRPCSQATRRPGRCSPRGSSRGCASSSAQAAASTATAERCSRTASSTTPAFRAPTRGAPRVSRSSAPIRSTVSAPTATRDRTTARCASCPGRTGSRGRSSRRRSGT